MRAELEPILAAARSLSPEELPRFIGELEEVRTTALVRLTAPVVHSQPNSLLDVDHAAERLGMSHSYLYRNAGKFAFTRREGRALRFSSQGIEEYLNGHRFSRRARRS